MKEPKKTKRGQNNITIYATVELKQFIEKVKHSQKQNLLYNAHFIARDFLIRYKDVFIAMFGKKKYEEELKVWSRTQNEIRDENKRKKEEAIKQKEEKLALEKEKLEVWKHSVGYEGNVEPTEPIREKCPKCGSKLGHYQDVDLPNLIRYCPRCKKKFTKSELKEHKP